MKINQTIYFAIIILGALIVATGNELIRRDYALGLGMVLLMFGIYKASQSWGYDKPDKQDAPTKQNKP